MSMKTKTSPAKVLAILAVGLCASLATAFAADTAAGNAGILAAYERMHATLAADSTEGVTADARAIAKMAREMAAAVNGGAALEEVAKAAEQVKSDDLARIRDEFKRFSVTIARAVESGALAGADIYFCSMADGYWLQAKDDTKVRNPYYGSSMLGCGWIVEKVGT